MSLSLSVPLCVAQSSSCGHVRKGGQGIKKKGGGEGIRRKGGGGGGGRGRGERRGHSYTLSTGKYGVYKPRGPGSLAFQAQ